MPGPAIFMMLFMMLISIAAVVFWVWTLIDCVTNKRLTDTQKVVWALVIFFIGFVGSLIYFFAGRAPRVYIPAQPYYYAPQAFPQPRPVEIPTENYHPYQEGYRVQEQAQAYQYSEPATTDEEQRVPPQVQHEHIQISYPE